ncbi:unnamed protein product [Cylindrotheca closterium]|uniref:Uncharacterized protein n=1 Tax=Cylindrotheca closterium TaxID=2856 RepID=A0AAD2FLP8_9STRA|nr:unnamed protein product [Cylindrotheca closterium]
MCTRQQTIQLASTVPSKLETARSTVSSTMKKSSVYFSETVKVRYSLSLEDYSDEEYDACWYSSEEYQTIEKDLCRQFMKMEEGKILHDMKSCSRGLERYLTVNAFQKKESQRVARRSVLDEQTHQAELNQRDEEAIARLYNNVSSSCQMWAAVLGLRDQREAEKYIQDDDLETRFDDLETLTQAQESQESSIRQDYVAPQKIYDSSSTRAMTSPQQMAVTARSA